MLSTHCPSRARPPVRTQTGRGLHRLVPRLGLAVLALACSAFVPWRAAAAEPANRTGMVPQRQRAAAALFARQCANCHQRAGLGHVANPRGFQVPDFTNRGFQQGRSDAQLMASILDGKGTGMPAFRGKIDEERARDLAGLVRTFGRDDAPAAGRRGPAPAEERDRRSRPPRTEGDEPKKRPQPMTVPPPDRRPRHH